MSGRERAAVTADDFDAPAIQRAVGSCLSPRCRRPIAWVASWGGYAATCRCGWRWTWERGSDVVQGVLRPDWSNAPDVFT